MSESATTPLVSAILVCHNDGKWLPRCLESLKRQTIFERIELIIADNASTDGTDGQARSLIADWPNARFFPTGGDNGFDIACNRAAEIARGKYLYLLNPDTWLEPDCVERLYATAEREQVGVVAASILEYENDDIQAEGGTGFDFCGNWVTTKGSYRPKELICPSNFFFVRRELFLKVGMLDEAYFMYGEEMDLGWRIWISGERIIPCLEARIHHRGAATVNPAGGTKVVEHRTSIQKRFLSNRNHLLFIATNCRNVLLFMLIPSAVLLLVEGLAIWTATRRWSTAKAASFDAFAGFWRLRKHIVNRRRQITSFRVRGDLWMLRFFRLAFGRSAEIKQLLTRGFPKISS